MKRVLPFLLLAFLAGSCSKKPGASSGDSSSDAGKYETLLAGWPYNVTVIETDDEKEKAALKKQTGDLFQAKNFEAIDVLAAKYRKSEECYANGIWKLNEIYAALDLPEEASETEWTNHLQTLRDWIGARPESITPRVALAESLTSYAWKARGGGWANSVTDQGWEHFGERLKESVRVLVAAKKLKEKCPRWYSVMMTCALGLSMDRADYDQLFEEAISSHPSYTMYYRRRAYFLLPRWNGKEGEWEEDLRKSADKLGGDAGDLLYARVVWEMHGGRYFGNIFSETQISWPRVNNGFAIMIKSFPDSFSAKSERAYLAALAKDRENFKTYLDELEMKVDPSVWHTKENFNKFARVAYGGKPKQPATH
jgi:hypothetical protein